MNVITDLWRRKLVKLWKLCVPWKDKPTPHRFRHTFARILLERPGVTVRDVAELLGKPSRSSGSITPHGFPNVKND
jgi:integrase